MDKERVKERTREAYDKVGADYDNWYWMKKSRELRAGVTKKVFEVLEKENNFKKPKILDLCCGTGHLAKGLSQIGDYTGADFSKSMVESCSVKYPKEKFVLGDAEELPFKENSFDIVICFWAFHHFVNPEKALGEMRRVLKPGGLVLIATFKDARLNPLAWSADWVSSAYWGFATKRYSRKEMESLLGPRFKSVKIEIYPTGFSVLNTLGIRFLIASGRK